MNIVEAALAAPWAMTEEKIQEVLAIAAREHEQPAIEMLQAYRARHVAGAERLKARDGVGIIQARGAMFKYANLFTAISDATSYEMVRLDLQQALDDHTIRAIALLIDSPGGEASGVDELAKAVFEARGRKPITAYISGTGASAAYWLAAAADEVVISDLAVVGSIGVRMAALDTSERDRKSGIARIEIVSSQTPGKRSDPTTDDGRARLQRVADSMADIFIAAVARYRGVTAETVIQKFGAGDVLVGPDAVAAGLADRIGSFEAVIAELSRGQPRKPTLVTPKGALMSTETTISMEAHQKALAEAKAESAKASQDRITAILDSEHARGRETLARHFAFKTTTAATDAIAALQAAPRGSEPKAVEPPKDPPKPADKPYLERKAEDKALGLGAPEAPKPSATASWDKAIAKVNARIKAA